MATEPAPPTDPHATPPVPKAGIDTWLGRIKSALEIIAIPVAAFWVYTNFQRGDAPLLEARHTALNTVSWLTPPDGESCIGQMSTSIQNIGKTPFIVKSVEVSAVIPMESKQDNAIDVLPVSLPPQAQDQATSYVAKQLLGTIAPDQKLEQKFAFRFRKQPGRQVVFRLSAIRTSSTTRLDQDLVAFDLVEWAYVCGEADIQKKVVKPPAK